jgi:hypothetical protein
MWPVPALAYTIWSDLQVDISPSANGGSVKRSSPVARTQTHALKEKRFKQIELDMQVVPIGPQGGVGVIFGWRIPSFLVWLLKARTFGIDKAPGLATGEQFLKP